MAAYIAKQVVGKKLESVKGALTDDRDEKKGGGGGDVDDAELQEAKREAEERRREKHRRQEDDRERMRQDIRDKYGLKKKDELGAPDSDAKTRKKRSNVGLESEGEEDGSSAYPKTRNDSQPTVSDLPPLAAGSPSRVAAPPRNKCTLQ